MYKNYRCFHSNKDIPRKQWVFRDALLLLSHIHSNTNFELRKSKLVMLRKSRLKLPGNFSPPTCEGKPKSILSRVLFLTNIQILPLIFIALMKWLSISFTFGEFFCSLKLFYFLGFIPWQHACCDRQSPKCCSKCLEGMFEWTIK